MIQQSTAYYKKLNISKIEDLYTLGEAKLMHKFFGINYPTDFPLVLLQKMRYTHKPSTRHPPT